MSKKTEWYPDDFKPTRPGLYETRVGGFSTWSVWKDGYWHFACAAKNNAVSRAEAGHKSFWQVREWRGLTASSE